MLQRIRVKNFKSLKDLDYKCANLNLLTGLNGAGKSSFVQLLLLMREVSKGWHSGENLAHTKVASFGTYRDLRYCYALPNETVSFAATFSHRLVSDVFEDDPGRKSLFADAVFEDLMADGKKSDFTIVRELVDLSEDRRYVDVVHPSYNAINHSKDFEEYIGFLNEHGGREAVLAMDPGDSDEPFQLQKLERILRERVKSVCAEVKKSDVEAAKVFERHWKGMKMVDAFRIKPKAIHEGRYLRGKKSESGSGFDPEGSDVVEFLYKFGRTTRLVKNNPMLFPHGEQVEDQYRDLIDQVNFWLEVVSPGATLKVERAELGDEERFLASVNFDSDGEESPKEFKPENVGFGISYILPVLVTLLSAKPEDIVIVENPEAHLHPKGQAKMGELIARAVASGVQVFVETHSDHVINGIRVAVAEKILKPEDVNIAFFERKEHGAEQDGGADSKETYAEVRNIKVDDQGSLSEYPADFMDEWNNQLMELIS